MTWIQFALLAVVNSLSIFGTISVLKWMDTRRKRKFVESFLDQMEDKISTEIKFGDLVKRFQEDEDN